MIYFDNCATTKPDASVLNTFVKVNTDYYFNPNSPHEKGLETSKLLENARAQIKSVLKLDAKQDVVFTSGATESNNLLITGMARAKKKFGHTIITSKLEHPSVLETIRALEDEGFNIKYVRFNADGLLDFEHFKTLLNQDVVLVSLMHVNNVMGYIFPIEKIYHMIKQYPKIHFHVDCVQSFGKIPLPVHCMDSFSLSGHKFNGLKGQGLLVLSQLKTITHTLFGGGQEYGFRSGTVNVASNVALSRAIRLADLHQNALMGRLYQFKSIIEESLKVYPGIAINSRQDGAPHIVNVSFKGVKGEVIVNSFSKRGIMISTTSACSSKRSKLNESLLAFGISDEAITGSVRISFDQFTTSEEVIQFIEIFKEVYQEMGDLIQ